MNEIEELVSTQKKNYRKLLELSRNLLSLLESSTDNAGIEQLLAAREELMASISKADNKINEASGSVKEGHPDIEEIKNCISEVLELDEKSRKLLVIEKSNIDSNMKNVSQGGAAVRRYLSDEGDGGHGRFISVRK